MENKRLDLTNISIDQQSLYKNIEKIKIAYFSDISRVMVDDVLRSISSLNLENTPLKTNDLSSKDIILIKEAIAAALCKIVGIEHPLHHIADQNIILTHDDEELCSYKFENDPSNTLNDF